MGDVIRVFRDAAYDPEALELLCTAYGIARSALHDSGQPPIVNEVIARRIIEQAESGEREPRALAAGALKTFGLHYLT